MSFLPDDDLLAGTAAGGGDAERPPRATLPLDALDAIESLDERVLADFPDLRQNYQDIIRLAFARVVDVLSSDGNDTLAVGAANRILAMFIKQQTQTHSDGEMAAMRAEFEELCALGRECFAEFNPNDYADGLPPGKSDGVL